MSDELTIQLPSGTSLLGVSTGDEAFSFRGTSLLRLLLIQGPAPGPPGYCLPGSGQAVVTYPLSSVSVYLLDPMLSTNIGNTELGFIDSSLMQGDNQDSRALKRVGGDDGCRRRNARGAGRTGGIDHSVYRVLYG